MKRKFISALKESGAILLSYFTERSDMGIQYYVVKYSVNNKKYSFDDGYFVGEHGAKEKVFQNFIDELKQKK